MMRPHFKALTALTLTAALTMSPARAFAQAAPQAAQFAAAPVTAVRLHVRTFKDKGTARLYIHRTDGSYAFVCASPCTADMAVGSELRVTLANNDEEPHTFVLPGDLGPEVDLEVRPPSVGSLVGSIVLMGSGGALVLSGLLFLALSGIRVDSSAGGTVTNSYKPIGYTFIGLGVACAAGGLIWLLTRSQEPRVQGAPYYPPAPVYGRGETLLGDVAMQKPRDPTTAIVAPSTPFQLQLSF